MQSCVTIKLEDTDENSKNEKNTWEFKVYTDERRLKLHTGGWRENVAALRLAD